MIGFDGAAEGLAGSEDVLLADVVLQQDADDAPQRRPELAVAAALTDREQLELNAVSQALERLRAGRYGQCRTCGVDIPFERGLDGHSDADVLLHAITDAVLGAAGLGDIGRHFPDTDAQFKGADSAVLLAEAMRRVREKGWVLVNIDSTIVAQAPKLAPHMTAIEAGVARALGVQTDQVNVKAKTAEKLGPVGQGQSMEARAVALLRKA